MDKWYLVNIVHNDFRQHRGIHPLFDGLEVSDLDSKSIANGDTHVNGVNGGAENPEKHIPERPKVNGEVKHMTNGDIAH